MLSASTAKSDPAHAFHSGANDQIQSRSFTGNGELLLSQAAAKLDLPGRPSSVDWLQVRR